MIKYYIYEMETVNGTIPYIANKNEHVHLCVMVINHNL